MRASSRRAGEPRWRRTRATWRRWTNVSTGSPPTRAATASLMDQVAELQEAWQHRVDALPPGRPPGRALREVRWLLEEYRVSLWAQRLGTSQPVSDARIRKALERS